LNIKELFGYDDSWSLIATIRVVVTRVLLDWIAGLFNPDCNPYWWIGLFYHFNPNPKNHNLIHELKYHDATSQKPKLFSKIKIFKLMFDIVKWVGKKDVPYLKLQHKTSQSNYKVYFYDELNCEWIWIGLSIHFEKWIWIVNNIFLMDLDWIDNPKKMDLATACARLVATSEIKG